MERSKSKKNLVVSHEVTGQHDGGEVIRLATKNPGGLCDALEECIFTRGGGVGVIINGVDGPDTLVGRPDGSEPVFWHSSTVMPLADFVQIETMPEGIELPAYGEALLFVPPSHKEADKGFSIGSLNRDAEFSSLVMSCFKKL